MDDPNASRSSAETALRFGTRWSGRSRGGYWGNWWFIQLVRFAGLRAAYLFLLPVAAYFTCASPQAYRCSVDFLRRVLGSRPAWKWPFLVYRHFLSHGISLLDRVAVIMARRKVSCVFEGEAMFQDCLSPKRGIILLAAHLGSWELGGHVLGRLETPVNLVVLEQEEARVREMLGQALQDRQFRLLATDGHPLRSIPIAAALKRGEIVALQGDRSFGGQDVTVQFLGGPVRFPVGAYLLAAATGAPIFQVFVVRERLTRYRFVSFPPQFVGRELLRQPVEALRSFVEQYAERLASMARQYPFQWYNFYPFWEAEPAGPAPGANVAAPT